MDTNERGEERRDCTDRRRDILRRWCVGRYLQARRIRDRRAWEKIVTEKWGAR